MVDYRVKVVRIAFRDPCADVNDFVFIRRRGKRAETFGRAIRACGGCGCGRRRRRCTRERWCRRSEVSSLHVAKGKMTSELALITALDEFKAWKDGPVDANTEEQSMELVAQFDVMLMENLSYVGYEEEWMGVSGDCYGIWVKRSNSLGNRIFGVERDILFGRDHAIFVSPKCNSLVLRQNAGL